MTIHTTTSAAEQRFPPSTQKQRLMQKAHSACLPKMTARAARKRDTLNENGATPENAGRWTWVQVDVHSASQLGARAEGTNSPKSTIPQPQSSPKNAVPPRK